MRLKLVNYIRNNNDPIIQTLLNNSILSVTTHHLLRTELNHLQT